VSGTSEYLISQPNFEQALIPELDISEVKSELTSIRQDEAVQQFAEKNCSIWLHHEEKPKDTLPH